MPGKRAWRRRAIRRRLGLRAAIGADVNVSAELHFARGDFALGVESDALAVDDKAHVRADLASCPEVERLLDDQVADAVVALDEPGYFRGGFRRSDVLFSLCRRREKADARHVLR